MKPIKRASHVTSTTVSSITTVGTAAAAETVAHALLCTAALTPPACSKLRALLAALLRQLLSQLALGLPAAALQKLGQLPSYMQPSCCSAPATVNPQLCWHEGGCGSLATGPCIDSPRTAPVADQKQQKSIAGVQLAAAREQLVQCWCCERSWMPCTLGFRYLCTAAAAACQVKLLLLQPHPTASWPDTAACCCANNTVAAGVAGNRGPLLHHRLGAVRCCRCCLCCLLRVVMNSTPPANDNMGLVACCAYTAAVCPAVLCQVTWVKCCKRPGPATVASII
jgi:hypothetical protein